MASEREDLREWLRTVLEHLGWTGSDLAKRISKVPSTINRFLNDPDATHSLSRGTLKAIELATGFAPGAAPGHLRPRGLSEPDSIRFDFDEGSGDAHIDAALRMLCGNRSGIDPWVLKSRALEAAGYFPGDVLIVDLNEQPRAHDIVCAQVYDWTAGRAETIMRIYEPPALVAATSDARLLKPYIVDNDRIVIKGVIVRSFRPRRSQPDAA